ncbi:MIP/aquaporin family protein [Aminipila luticellarii]|uniref:Aquaporin n=1 Tax=Aminipila luticellarii TaxID=2507160 RepID=A0A410PWT3_9FIRM|nr:MIP/aquaporin family protein [Aminipila luticellarii]QAT43403.1 aquaporin [Aminipila luticellarii]
MKKDSLAAQCLAEWFGTFFFLTIGIGSVAVLVLGLSDINYPWMAACWGVAITLAIYIVGGISGAHLNPAVTIALAAFGGFEKRKIIPYIAAQVLGGITAAALIYFLFRANIVSYESANGVVRGMTEGLGCGGIFVTQAGASVSMLTAFMNEMFLTFVLVLVIFAVTDTSNGSAPAAGLPAVAIGASVTFAGIALGPLTGFAMNPARDLGPRIFLLLSGWGSSALGEQYYGLIVPIFATILGGLIAGAFYKKVIAKHFI